ncbi:Ig-like domain-containing protein [Rhodanobacter aciditrophus]|uniref:Ig-like domain-containing protein n=2 Tax=Bacteria TaxID=2 RepID=A0ABW4B024_9GAMM
MELLTIPDMQGVRIVGFDLYYKDEQGQLAVVSDALVKMVSGDLELSSTDGPLTITQIVEASSQNLAQQADGRLEYLYTENSAFDSEMVPPMNGADVSTYAQVLEQQAERAAILKQLHQQAVELAQLKEDLAQKDAELAARANALEQLDNDDEQLTLLNAQLQSAQERYAQMQEQLYTISDNSRWIKGDEGVFRFNVQQALAQAADQQDSSLYNSSSSANSDDSDDSDELSTPIAIALPRPEDATTDQESESVSSGAELLDSAEAASSSESEQAVTDTVGDESTIEDATADDLTSDELTSDELTSDELTSDEATSDELTSDEATSDELTSDESTSDESTSDELTSDESTSDELTSDELTSDELTSDESTSDESTSDESTSDESTSDESTSDEATSDELTSDEANSDESTSDEATSDEAKKGLVWSVTAKHNDKTVLKENESNIAEFREVDDTSSEESIIPSEEDFDDVSQQLAAIYEANSISGVDDPLTFEVGGLAAIGIDDFTITLDLPPLTQETNDSVVESDSEGVAEELDSSTETLPSMRVLLGNTLLYSDEELGEVDLMRSHIAEVFSKFMDTPLYQELAKDEFWDAGEHSIEIMWGLDGELDHRADFSLTLNAPLVEIVLDDPVVIQDDMYWAITITRDGEVFYQDDYESSEILTDEIQTSQHLYNLDEAILEFYSQYGLSAENDPHTMEFIGMDPSTGIKDLSLMLDAPSSLSFDDAQQDDSVEDVVWFAPIETDDSFTGIKGIANGELMGYFQYSPTAIAEAIGEVGFYVQNGNTYSSLSSRQLAIIDELDLTADGSYVYGMEWGDSGAQDGLLKLAFTIDSGMRYELRGDLSEASDTGLSSMDGITSEKVLTFDGTGEPGATINVVVDGQAVSATNTVGEDGCWSATLDGPLEEGTYEYTVSETDANGNISYLEPDQVTVDTTAPEGSGVTLPFDLDSLISGALENEDGALIEIDLNGDDYGSATVENGTWSISGDAFNTGDTVVVTVTDLAGNSKVEDEVTV